MSRKRFSFAKYEYSLSYKLLCQEGDFIKRAFGKPSIDGYTGSRIDNAVSAISIGVLLPVLIPTTLVFDSIVGVSDLLQEPRSQR